MTAHATADAAVSPASAAWRSERAFALLGTALAVALMAWGASVHELWRDEMDAWLIARDSPTLPALFVALRYGGHPPLWYLLLWPLARAWPGAFWLMPALNVVIAGAAAWVVLRHAPGPRWARLGWVLSYFPLYEYGVIARNYALSVLALALLARALARRREAPFAPGPLVALLALTSPHGTILAMALTAAWGLDVLVRARPLDPRALAGLAVAAAGVVLTAWLIRVPPDASYAPGWHVHGLEVPRLLGVLHQPARAFLPLPWPGPGFWQHLVLTGGMPLGTGAAIGVTLLVGGAALLALASRDPLAPGVFLAGAGAVLAFGYLKFEGYLRHHGYVWLALAAGAWLAAAAPSGRARARRAGAALLAVLVAVHVASSAVALWSDARCRFSAAEGMAEALRTAGLADLPLAGAPDFTTMSVLAHLRGERAWFLDTHRWGSYIVYDSAREKPFEAWPEADALSARLGTPIVVVLNDQVREAQPPPAALAGRLRPVACVKSEVVSDESLCAWTLAPPAR